MLRQAPLRPLNVNKTNQNLETEALVYIWVNTGAIYGLAKGGLKEAVCRKQDGKVQGRHKSDENE